VYLQVTAVSLMGEIALQVAWRLADPRPDGSQWQQVCLLHADSPVYPSVADVMEIVGEELYGAAGSVRDLVVKEDPPSNRTYPL